LGDLHSSLGCGILSLLGAPACELQLTYDLAVEARRIRLPGIVYENGAREGRQASAGWSEISWDLLPPSFQLFSPMSPV
jgi:hypothetical protein